VVTGVRSTLDDAVAAARTRLADLTERCVETQDRADGMTAKVQARWQRRVELMRSRANADGARQVLES
jgi:hypothetical protein